MKFLRKLLTDRQTDRQTNRQRRLHNLLGGGNKCCISEGLMYVAAWSRYPLTKVHEIRGVSIGQTPKHAKFRQLLTRYPLSKICASEKWTKVTQNSLRPATHYARHRAKFHRARTNGQTVYEKSVTCFTPFTILALQASPGRKFTRLSDDV